MNSMTAALLAAGVVVHPLGRQLVARVTLAEVLLAHDAELGKKIQRPVHRGEAKLRVLALDPVVDLLRREVPLPSSSRTMIRRWLVSR